MKRQLEYFSILIGLLVLVPGWTQAAEIAVDADGMCTLADAITAANTDTATGGCSAGSGNDTITLETDVILDAELPEITSIITIEGQGYPIDGNKDSTVGSVLRIDVNGSLTMNKILVTGGNSSIGGGGIYNEGALALIDSMVNGNSVSCKDGTLSVFGGGIYSAGSLRMTDSMVNSNSVSCNDGESVVGGGIVNSSNIAAALISNSTISGNSLSCNNCSIDDLVGGVLLGGGIVNGGAGSTLILNNSTVSNNSVLSESEQTSGSLPVVYGGGVINLGDSTTSINITNSTISGNSLACNKYSVCVFVNGGGIANWKASSVTPDATTSLINSTITENSAIGFSRGVENNSGGTITLMGSIVSDNTASTGNEIYNDANSSIIVDSFNLFGHSGESNSEAFYGVEPGNSDVAATSDGTNPTVLSDILHPLADNGGPTMTHALVPGSPAIDLDPTCSTGLTTDQRGEPRPETAGTGCDAGSFEGSVSKSIAFLSAINMLLLKSSPACEDRFTISVSLPGVQFGVSPSDSSPPSSWDDEITVTRSNHLDYWIWLKVTEAPSDFRVRNIYCDGTSNEYSGIFGGIVEAKYLQMTEQIFSVCGTRTYIPR
ncbi:MAG: choice-of-anchor Q domain-containing protein [Candidatus Electrothrix communis]|nr:MAG: choice-of-anchor Q domain-containing protein [Candidatus Electrothrix communis]